MAKVLELQFQHQCFQWIYLGLISFRIDWFALFAVQGTLNSLLQHHNSKASILRCSAFLMVQLSHLYVTTGKAIALTKWIFFSKVMSLLFNMLSMFVIAFLPRNKCHLISRLQSPSTVILEPKKIKSVTASTFCPPAAAKSLQLCLILCDPIDGSPPGSPVPPILQARTLEGAAISFSNAWKWKVKVKLLSHIQLLATPWTAAYQAPPSMGFSRKEYWSGVPLPSPRIFCYKLQMQR